jgi:endoglucanase
MLTRCRRGLLLALLVAPRVLALVLSIVGAAAFNGGSLMSDGDAAPQLHVSGKELVNSSGQRLVLHGVDRSGGEDSCVRDKGIWDGPMDQTAVAAIKSWNVNAVRVPLNEACWNGQSYVNPAYAGKNYQLAVETYVHILNQNGMVAILDLQWSEGFYSNSVYRGTSADCVSAEALCEKPMPDLAQAVPFWNSVARAFAGNDAVIFDLFNESFPEAADNDNVTKAWSCWRDGGSACVGIPYPVAGMQLLVNTVRSTGANNVIMLGGLNFANDLTQWLTYEPTDPDHNLVASWHAYNTSPCNTELCWNDQVAPVIAKVPVITGEIGDLTCSGGFLDSLMSWLDPKSISYLAWTWNSDFGCASGPSLITSYAGTPTVLGATFKTHLAAEAKHSS